MKSISLVGWCYLMFGVATCGYFCTSAITGRSLALQVLPIPVARSFAPGNSTRPGSPYYDGGPSRFPMGSSRSSSSGRSWGGSWGGGK